MEPAAALNPIPLTCIAWSPECKTRECGYPDASSRDCMLKVRSDMPFFVHGFEQDKRRMVCALADGKVLGESEPTKDKCNMDVMNSLIIGDMLICPSNHMPILNPDGSIECMKRPVLEPPPPPPTAPSK